MTEIGRVPDSGRPGLPLSYFNGKKVNHTGISGVVEIQSEQDPWHGIVDDCGVKIGRIRSNDVETAHILWAFDAENRPYNRAVSVEAIEWIKWRYNLCHTAYKEKGEIEQLKKKLKKHGNTLRGKQYTLDNHPTESDDSRKHSQASLDNQKVHWKKKCDEVRRKEADLLKDEVIYQCNSHRRMAVFINSIVPHVNMSNTKLANWMNGKYGVRGRQRYLDPKQELDIMQCVLTMDAHGQMITDKWITDLVENLIGGKVTKNWLIQWFNRCKEKDPGLCIKFIRAINRNLLGWYSTANINWWYDTVKRRLLDEGVAEINPAWTPESAKNVPELQPLSTKRWIVTDESSLSSDKEKQRGAMTKAYTHVDHIDKNTHRARGSSRKEPSNHITIVAGHSFDGETVPPAFILQLEKMKQADRIRYETTGLVPASIQKEMDEAVKQYGTSRTLGTFNQREYHKAIVGLSKSGSITKDNIRHIVSQQFEVMFPDLDPSKPQKKVVWFTDWHSSRTDPELISWLRAKGIILICWLPNCTSVMQSPDVALFGPWKKKFTKLKTGHKGTITRSDQVNLGMQALTEITRNNSIYSKGLKLSGMVPFTRKAHLVGNATIVAKADRRRELQEKQTATTALHQRIAACSILVAENEQQVSNVQVDNTNTPSPVPAATHQPPQPLQLFETGSAFTLSRIVENFEKLNPPIGDLWSLHTDVDTPETVRNKALDLQRKAQGRIMQSASRRNLYREALLEETSNEFEERKRKLDAALAEVQSKYEAELKNAEITRNKKLKSWEYWWQQEDSDSKVIVQKCEEIIYSEEISHGQPHQSNQLVSKRAKELAALFGMWEPIEKAVRNSYGMPVELRDKGGLHRLITTDSGLSPVFQDAIGATLESVANPITPVRRQTTIHAAGNAIRQVSPMLTSSQAHSAFSAAAAQKRDQEGRKKQREAKKEKKYLELRLRVLSWAHQDFIRTKRPSIVDLKRYLGLEASRHQKATQIATQLKNVQGLRVSEGFWEVCVDFLRSHFSVELESATSSTA